MSVYPTKSYPVSKGLSEFEILKTSHKFLREDTNENQSQSKDNENGEGTSTSISKKTWEDQLAEKYYESLYREFAVCDLKHYKSGNFALRWRTESEVLSGAGESTCGNTRCKHHFVPSSSSNKIGQKRKEEKKEPKLTTLELPFAYIERGEPKNALVKVVLCTRCVKKLMWKRRKDKEEREMREHGVNPASVATMGDVSEDDESEREEEDEGEKVERMGTGKEREKEGTSIGDEEDPRPIHTTSEVKGRSRGKKHRDERDGYVEINGRTTKELRSRRRNSRSRSPRPHSDSHSQLHSREYARIRDRGNV